MRNKRSYPILIFVILTLWFALAFAQTPVINDEPVYTQGVTNTICWGPASMEDNENVLAYEVQVTDVFIGEDPYFPDEGDPDYSEFSIRPIPATPEYVEGLCYTVGLDMTEVPADDPLWDGVEYCYRLRYRMPGAIWGDWSNIVCSRQDNSVPLVTVDELPIWTNTAEFPVSFSIEDVVCQGVETVKLYYRECGTTDWELYPETMTVSPPVSPVVDAISFNSSTAGSYCCYEFFVGAVDSMGNELTPSTGAPVWTKVDHTPPTSSVDGARLPEYTTDPFFTAYYDGEDVTCPSGIDNVQLAYKYGTDPDVYIYDTHVWEGALTVSDEFDFSTLTTRGDGEYKLYTIATDSAGNIETYTGIDDHIYVDTEIPRVGTVDAADQTTETTLSRYDVSADAGWTNATEVNVTLNDEIDPINGDYYASGLETVIIAWDEDFTTGYSEYPYVPDFEYPFEIPSGDGPKDIYVKVQDVAGNYSVTDYESITLDTEPPCIDSIDIEDRDLAGTDTTDEMTVRVHISPDTSCGDYTMMFLTQDAADLESIAADDWEEFDYTTTFSFTGYSDGDWMTLYVVLKDNAGNVSEAATDDIHLLRGCKVIELIDLLDITGRSCDINTYTCSTMIDVKIRYGRDIDSIGIWDDAASDMVFQAVAPLESCDTMGLIILPFELTRASCVTRTVYTVGKYNHDPVLTDSDMQDIILDLDPPDLPSVSLRDISTTYSPSDTSEVADIGWTNHAEIKVIFNDPYDYCTDICGLKVTSGTSETEEPFDAWIYFDIPTGDGAKIVEAFVKDSAGNWSAPAESIIRLDTYRPTITTVICRDRNTGAESSSDEATIHVDTECDDGIYADPAYIAVFEDPGLWPASLSDRWQEYNDRVTYTFVDPGYSLKTVYVAVKDHAGNISLRSSDDINYVSPCGEFEITAYDLNADPPDNEFTNERLVAVDFTIDFGSPPAFYAISEDEMDIPALENPFPADSVANYTITSAGEGEKTLYAWLLTEAGDTCGYAEYTITLDMTPPIINNYMVVDPTEADDFPDEFMADMYWSNELNVWGRFESLDDPLSGVDSIKFEGDIEEELWDDIPFNTVDGAIIIGFEHYEEEGVPLILIEDDDVFARPVTLSGLDHAENWGSALTANSKVTVDFNVDRIAPEFYFCDAVGEEIDSVKQVPLSEIPLYITDAPENGSIWKVYFWIEHVPGTLAVAIDDLWTGDGVVSVPFPFYDYFNDPANQNIRYNVHALVVDKGGNPSAVDILVWSLVPPGERPDLTLYDPVDTDDYEYTNSQTVTTHISIETPPDWMRFAETYDGVSDQEWVAYSEYSDFTFANTANEMKYVFCQVKHGNFPSAIDTAYIILDTRPPTLGDIVLYDKTDDDAEWSDELEVKVELVDPTDAAPGEVASLKMAEDEDFTINVQTDDLEATSDYVYYTFLEQPTGLAERSLSGDGQEDKRILYAKLLDRAENESAIIDGDILVDVEGMELVNYPNPFNPIDGVTWIRVKAKQPDTQAEMKIFDMFGNLVWTKDVTLSGKVDDIEWDGTNDKGTVVANGGYICIVKVNGEEMKRKIAVWKASNEE
ncbi:hypothetical protein JXI42_06015 [bacterium]|nr:hypothetical protein [bacterium]